MRLAALGLSYAQAGRLVGSVKSTLCRWVRRRALREPELSGRVWELDGMWTRTRSGPREMRVIRDERGTALGSFQPWSEVIDQAWRQAERTPVHLVSDDDGAIAAGIELVYGREAPHQLCQFHLLREYRRNVGYQGFRAAKALLQSSSRSEAEEHAREAIIRSRGEALDWCRKALGKGMTHLGTGQERHRTTSRLERQNREYRRREKMGTVWSPHNLLALLQLRGLINQTT